MSSAPANASSYVLGIDGGGTKTIACLAPLSGNQILGRGASGPSNPQVVGFNRAVVRLDEAIAAAFAAAGVPRQRLPAACLAIAGAGRAEDQQRLRRWCEEANVAERLLIVHDARPVLASGTPLGWGVALIAGTGSLAFGRDKEGAEERVGGWGYLIGDEGSGYQIAIAGLRAVAQAADGRAPATGLVQRFLRHLNIRTPEELIGAIYGQASDRAAIAALAVLVLDAAQENDALAVQIVRQATLDLADMVSTLVKKLKLPAQFPLALTGGLLLENQLLQEGLLDELSARELQAAPVTAVADPVSGAVRLAQELANEPI